MTVSALPTPFTPADLLILENEGLFELVNGELVEKEMSSLASKTAARITYYLAIWTQNFQRGEIYPEQSFACFPAEPEKIRRPDIAMILADRVKDVPAEGHVPIPPDLAIEVVSPNDKIYELDEKLLDYRAAGIKLVWVVNPNSRTIRIYRLDHTVTELGESETLTGEDVLVGFSVAVQDLLPVAEPK